jgi:hypothetical protein
MKEHSISGIDISVTDFYGENYIVFWESEEFSTWTARQNIVLCNVEVCDTCNYDYHKKLK